jgi:hypothetical protein
MKRYIFMAACLLAGCASKDADPVVSVVEAVPIALPAECTAPDAKWMELPAGDVTRSQAVAQHDTNKGRYNRILARRTVCRAAINASKG